MPYRIYLLPDPDGRSSDIVFLDPKLPDGPGFVHFAYAVSATRDALQKRSVPWTQMREFRGGYKKRCPEAVDRLQNETPYWPGEETLSAERVGALSAQDAIMRLGALELLGNIASGRLASTDTDPFPHQLALQQRVRHIACSPGPKRILIADEVGLGKTIEAGLILRDLLVACHHHDQFKCLYLTSRSLVDDAVGKLRTILKGTSDGQHLVRPIHSFRQYGNDVSPTGIVVGSMHAARRYVTAKEKASLLGRVQPDVIIIDECHHAASEDPSPLGSSGPATTKTYLAAHQLLSGTYWAESQAPRLAILMSATPFRSMQQFENLLRLLTDGIRQFDAFKPDVTRSTLRQQLSAVPDDVLIAWRRQSDSEVRSWAGHRIFPNLTVVRPHTLPDDSQYPRLREPDKAYLALLSEIVKSVSDILREQGSTFGGFARLQLEKRLTSGAIAGACHVFRWAVRRGGWPTKEVYRNSTTPGVTKLRQLLLEISRKLGAGQSANFASVEFATEPRMTFEARELSQSNTRIHQIYDFYKKFSESDDAQSATTLSDGQMELVCDLALKLLAQESTGDCKLEWVREMLKRFPNERFVLFTESLQTCRVLEMSLGTQCVLLTGAMDASERAKAIAELQSDRGRARILVATSAGDEGLDLQVASKVVHWDLSSSPAVLMQRNGRAARLGQIRDVTAFYLILPGTHEAGKDALLLAKFAVLGIEDEDMQARVLGTLSEEEQDCLLDALRRNDEHTTEEILKKAKRDNEEMNRRLEEIRASLQPAHVLSREDLLGRLKRWKELGPRDRCLGGVSYEIVKINWNRPVFRDVSTLEPAVSEAVTLSAEGRTETFLFDPECRMYAGHANGKRHSLAGLTPWLVKATEDNGVRPGESGDLFGRIMRGLARMNNADFVSIQRAHLPGTVGKDTRWLLFCTHPLREIEAIDSNLPRPYLTYYEFGDLEEVSVPDPLDCRGADAVAVHSVIDQMEVSAVEMRLEDELPPEVIEESRRAGMKIAQWLGMVTRFARSSFLEEESFFVPMPVTLVRVAP